MLSKTNHPWISASTAADSHVSMNVSATAHATKFLIILSWHQRRAAVFNLITLSFMTTEIQRQDVNEELCFYLTTGFLEGSALRSVRAVFLCCAVSASGRLKLPSQELDCFKCKHAPHFFFFFLDNRYN